MQKIILLLLIIILTFSCNKKGYSIDAIIEGVEDGRKVTLKKRGEEKIIIVDSTTIQNGKFSFKGIMEEPTHFGIFIDKITKQNEGIFPLLNINDHIKIVAYKDSLHTSKVTGSVFNSQLTKLRLERDKISAKAKLYAKEYQEARKTNDTTNINKIKKIYATIQDEISLNDWNFILKNPDSYVAPMVLNGLIRDLKYKDSIQPAFDSFSKEIQNSIAAKPVRDYFEYITKQNAPKKEIPTTPKQESKKE